MKRAMIEDEVEQMMLDILKELKYKIVHGPDIAPDTTKAARNNYEEVLLGTRLEEALRKINPHLTIGAVEQAIKTIRNITGPNHIKNNHEFHKLLIDGVPVEYKKGSSTKHDNAQLIDWNNLNNNEFAAINQFTITNGKYNRRPDVIIFVNGIPLAVIELKNPADKTATLTHAYKQLQTYKDQIPQLFTYNSFLVISDGLDAAAGTITSNRERFMGWKTITGEELIEKKPQLPVLTKGMFEKKRFLDIIRHFIVFEKQKSGYSKKLAAYHQYHAANKAMSKTLRVEKPKGDGRAGVIWHTQGSGKSLTMLCYAGKLILAHDNPTIVVLTDRNDLDDQLFQTFANSQDTLRQKPEQATSRAKLRELLKRNSGGVIFTTIQKFFPEERGDKHPILSDRTNIVVMADEAHRTQYGFEGHIKEVEDDAYITYGYAKHLRDALPNASYIGFTGTPIEKEDKSTPAVFGDYIDIYDIRQAVNDGATVSIYYENRYAKTGINPEERPYLDEHFEEVTEGEEQEAKEKLKTKWARMEKVVGAPEVIKRVAKDFLLHYERRQETLQGKVMFVCMSRRICVALHEELKRLRPAWYSEDDKEGEMKVVMTGAAKDPKSWQEHIRNKSRRKALGERMKDPDDPLKLVIVRDMWLTGFDAPSMHSMYVMKPMTGHNLMQAIARVNRVFKDKPGGLIVDYIGIAYELKKALKNYSRSGGKGKPTIDQAEAVALMMESYEVVRAMYHGFDYNKFFTGSKQERLGMLPDAMEHILAQDDGKKRYQKHVAKLAKAYALAVPHEKAEEVREEVAFFRAVRAAIVKTTTAAKEQRGEQLDTAIQSIVSKAIVSDRVIDIFKAAGLKKPDISILNEEFLMEVKNLPQKNLVFEALRKLLQDEITVRSKKNVVIGRSFTELLEKAIKRYQNRSLESAEVIEELIELARQVRVSDDRGDKLGINEDELAFYDALANHKSARDVMGEDKLGMIAQELVRLVKQNATIDWAVRESVQAKMRVMVKRLLRKYGYPPDQQAEATELVLEQAKLLFSSAAEASA